MIFQVELINTKNDIELAVLVANRKTREAAFREIFFRYSKKIYFYCRKFLGNEATAEDITQDIFICLLKYIDSGKKVDNLQGLLFRIGKNLCINSKRSGQRLEVLFEENLPVFPDSSHEMKELAKMIDSALELLPEDHREAFCLQMYYSLSYSEIAEISNVPVSTVRNWIVRAKLKLRKILAPYFEETR